MESDKVANSLNDAARGCMLGSLVGDAAGALIEFMYNQVSEDIAEHALTFPGSKYFAPGQISCDSEMALSLLKALLSGDGVLNTQEIAYEYSKWFHSSPNGLGKTITKAMKQIPQSKEDINVEAIHTAIKKLNPQGTSSGGIMRVTPMGIWSHKLSNSNILTATTLEQCFTHASYEQIIAVTCYHIAIKHLLTNLGDRSGAVQEVSDFISTLAEPCETVRQWFETSQSSELDIDTNSANSKISFILAFHYLHKGYGYEDAIRQTLLMGGDTDTNASIVGGLIGAAEGEENLPQKWVVKVLNCEESKRPTSYQTQSKDYIEAQVFLLVDMAPDDEDFKWTYKTGPAQKTQVIPSQVGDTQPEIKSVYPTKFESISGDKASDTRDAALGCVFGALIGDASGAPLEFMKGKISDQKLEDALGFNGGGAMGVAPGQITDDSEMALCLARALINGNGKLDVAELAYQYWLWYMSGPIDIGFTTRYALDYFNEKDKMDVKECLARIDVRNHKSISNGCLMRITPLSVWAYKLSPEYLTKASFNDTSCTHGHKQAKLAVAVYNITIAYLLNNPGDREGALAAAEAYIDEFDQKKKYLHEWWQDVLNDEIVTARKSIGWVRIALCYSFKYLKEGASYEDAIRKMLHEGGDTDTNAAIVGGMVGAAVGLSNLPEKWVESVMDAKAYDRPKEFRANSSEFMTAVVDKLLELAPTDEELDITY